MAESTSDRYLASPVTVVSVSVCSSRSRLLEDSRGLHVWPSRLCAVIYKCPAARVSSPKKKIEMLGG